MSEIQKKTVSTTLIAAGAGIGLVCLLFWKRAKIRQQIQYVCDFRNPLRHQKIEIIENVEDCHRVLSNLKKHCQEYRVLGFDCEWVTVGGSRRPTALLQLASHTGLCALIRLCKLKSIPKSLRDILEDDRILKVGVVPSEDAIKLSFDYGVGVASTLDLRFLAMHANRKPEGLGKLSKSIINIELDKNWRLRCSDWEAKILNEKQIDYAAKDALVAIEIFKKLSEEILPRRFWQNRNSVNEEFISLCEPYIELKFMDNVMVKMKKMNININKSRKLLNKNPENLKKYNHRTLVTRANAHYDNILMEAPDGELLCTCDKGKAKWYIDQDLAEVVNNEPYTIRLKFEPSGRAVSEVGRYYTLPKENKCVVCGREDSFIRKNVVPREYRKHFPEVMKAHTSHDVLLLCPKCHQLSNMSDIRIRQKLAENCDAPIKCKDGTAKYIEDPKLRQLKSAARALLLSSSQIPLERQEKLKEIILEHYPSATELTNDLLEYASNVEVLEPNDSYCSHGLKVVVKYQEDFGGLIELEKIWREHFLNTMRPKYMPELWSVNHNANRLEIRATEGRVEKDDMLLAGLDPSTVVPKEVQTLTNEN